MLSIKKIKSQQPQLPLQNRNFEYQNPKWIPSLFDVVK